MVILLFAPAANEFLNTLELTPTRRNLLAGMNSALDVLERDPRDERSRRRRFSTIGCWARSLEAESTEWLILWEEGDEETAVIRAIVSAPS